MNETPLDDLVHGMSNDFRRDIAGWVPVVTMDGGGGYDWTTFHAFYSPAARRYFWAGGSGCSCNYWGQKISSVGDFENGDRPALMAALRRFAEKHEYTFRVNALVDALTKANAFNPKGNNS